MVSTKKMDHYLLPIFENIPRELISESQSYKVLHTAKVLPEGWLKNTFGFECPLYTAEPHADFLLSTNTPSKGYQLLQATAASNDFESKVWADVERLGRLWEEQKGIDDFWLEFDINGDCPKVPSLFFRPLYSSSEDLSTILKTTIQNLTGLAENKALLASVDKHVRALPPRAKVFQVGAMRSRPHYGLRLCIHEISLDAILRYLAAINYPAAIEPIKGLLVFLQALVYDVTFSIDLTPGLQTKIGFECYTNLQQSDAERKKSLRRMLKAFVAKGWVTEEKADALLTFEQINSSEALFEKLPEQLACTQQFLGAHATSWIKQFNHHIKLTYEPSAPIVAKAYLAVQHLWR